MAAKRILITGVSSGLGKVLAQEALQQGWTVMGTVRQEEARRDFEASAPGQAHGRLLDVRQTDAMPGLVRELEHTVGPVDAFVNNAGNGLLSTIEEHRMTEALRQEVSEFGIHVTAIEPGVFQTDWSGRSQQHAPESIRDYDGLRERRASQEINWNGDLQKGARAMLTILEEPEPPGHLLLGSVAGDLVAQKLDTLREEFARFRELTYSTDIDGSAPGLLRQL